MSPNNRRVAAVSLNGANKRGQCTFGPLLTAGAAAILLLQQGTASAQPPAAPAVSWWQQPGFGPELANALNAGGDDSDNNSILRTSRIPMPNMLPGFLSEPPGLSSLDDPAESSSASASTNSPDGFVLTFGDDNPFFDPRRPGDPGGVGFIRIHSQVQVVDWNSTSVCFGLRGWTPAGLENGGVQSGQTVMAPGVGVFQDLGSGTALHGFVDQSFHAGGSHQGPMRCGMAVNCPLTTTEDTPADRGLFFFVQALGRLDYGSDRQGRAMNWELVPGIHWRLSDSFWLSLGASRSSALTCWWHF
jgi:hypothetical protein